MSLDVRVPTTLAPGALPAERLLAAAEAAQMGLWDADTVTGHATWSIGMYALLGLDPATTRAHVETWRARIHPDDYDVALGAYRHALADPDGLYAVTYRIVRADTGAPRWVDARGRIVRAAPDRFVGVVVDVTDRRHEEERLRESEARVRAALEDTEERRRAAERTAALQRVTAALSAATTRDEVARVVAGLAAQFMEARTGSLALRDGDAVELLDAPDECREWQRLPLDAELPVPASIRDGRPLLFESRAQLAARFPEAAPFAATRGIEAVIVMPVAVGGQVAGAVAFSYPAPRAVDSPAAAQLDALARLVADALERVRLVDALRRELAEREQAEREFRMLAETVPDLVFTTTPDGTLTWYNSRTAEFSGQPWSPEAAGQWRGGIHPDDVDMVAARWTQALRTGQPYESEARWRRVSDGTWRWMLNRALPLRGDDGAIRLWVGTSTDVHERRLATERASTLQRVTAALGAAVDVTAVSQVLVREAMATFEADIAGLWVPDATGAALERVEALQMSEETRRRWTRLSLDVASPATEAYRTGELVVAGTPAELARFPLLADSFAKEGFVCALAVPMLAEDRVIGVLSLGFRRERAVPDEERALLRTVAQQAALSVERARLYEAERLAHAEAERARADAERARQAAEEARTRAEEASRAKSEFLAIMSHELRTPLNAIAGHVELLEMGIHGELSDRQLDALGRVARAQRHLLGLINDVLNLSRIEAGRVEYAIDDVDLGDVVRGLAPLIEPQLASRRLAYEVALPDAPLLVRADRDKLQQVLLNLLANAAKYTEPGGHVRVDTAWREGAGDLAFVRVHDTGCGIAREKLDQVFEPFVRVDSAHTRRTDGAGLGLAIARDLARGMGGDLRARSIVGEGSTFTIALPLAGSTADHGRP